MKTEDSLMLAFSFLNQLLNSMPVRTPKYLVEMKAKNEVYPSLCLPVSRRRLPYFNPVKGTTLNEKAKLLFDSITDLLLRKLKVKVGV